MSIFAISSAASGLDLGRALVQRLPRSRADLHTARRAAEIVGTLGRELLHVERGAPHNVRRACERLGVTFIKMAQVVSSTYGVFPPRYSAELSRCLDRVPPMTSAVLESVLTAAYGRPVRAVFATFDGTPMASASVAQVHAATLPDGRRVAVKVKRPGLTARIAQDIAIARGLVDVVRPVSEWAATVNLSGIIDEFERTVNEELDFRAEAAFMDRYRRRVADVAGGYVFVPRAFPEYSNADVLVMELVEGVPLTQVEPGAEFDGYELIARLLRTWCEIILRTGEYHGDMHAGNVLFVPPNRLALVDFGVVGVLDERRRHALFDLLVFTLLGDDVLLARHFKRMGFVPEQADDGMIRGRLREILERGRREATLDIRFEDMFPDIIALAHELGGSVPREVMLLSRQQIYLAAHCRRLAPGRDVLKHPCMSELLFPPPRMTFIPAPVSHPRYRLPMPDDVPSARLLSCPICCTVMESDVDYVEGGDFTCYACLTALVVVREGTGDLAMAPV